MTRTNKLGADLQILATNSGRRGSLAVPLGAMSQPRHYGRWAHFGTRYNSTFGHSAGRGGRHCAGDARVEDNDFRFRRRSTAAECQRRNQNSELRLYSVKYECFYYVSNFISSVTPTTAGDGACDRNSTRKCILRYLMIEIFAILLSWNTSE